MKFKIPNPHDLRGMQSQSAEIIINSPDVKYDFGFIWGSGTCQSAKGFFSKATTMGLIILRGLRIELLQYLVPGGKSWINAAIFN